MNTEKRKKEIKPDIGVLLNQVEQLRKELEKALLLIESKNNEIKELKDKVFCLSDEIDW
tara:strand:- start:5 stop:181 length:177 start_codon:yes stop_codon:yes gene_type:complete